jgi:hypothetical protein
MDHKQAFDMFHHSYILGNLWYTQVAGKKQKKATAQLQSVCHFFIGSGFKKMPSLSTIINFISRRISDER